MIAAGDVNAGWVTDGTIYNDGSVRKGNVTRGKRKGVKYIIKVL